MSRRDEQGTVTVFVLGISLSILLLLGITVDLWRGLAHRRELAVVADAAAVAGANGIDEDAARVGEIRLEPDRVRRLVRASLAAHDGSRFELVEVGVDARSVTVVLRGEVDLSLARLSGSREPIAVTVSARAAPERVP